MANDSFRICFKEGDSTYKICRVIYGSDGSFYVTAPYHSHESAALSIMTVNYDVGEQLIAAEQAIDAASYDSEESRVKYSHHPDGFIQFSGAGIVSGRHEDGSAKGIGIQSWPLAAPVAGPAFAITIVGGFSGFDIADKVQKGDFVFNRQSIGISSDHFRLTVEGHYFPQVWSRFIRRLEDDRKEIQIAHPAGGVINMAALLPSPKIPIRNFLGVEVYAEEMEASAPSTVLFAGSTGNIRFNEKGEKLGDGIFYMFPRGKMPVRRSINYRRS